MSGFILPLDRIKKMKMISQLTLPHIKTGHRTEIVARLLGWRTYAALLHDVRSEAQFINEFDFETTLEFCNKLDLNVDKDDLQEMVERFEDEFGSQAESISNRASH